MTGDGRLVQMSEPDNSVTNAQLVDDSQEPTLVCSIWKSHAFLYKGTLGEYMVLREDGYEGPLILSQ